MSSLIAPLLAKVSQVLSETASRNIECAGELSVLNGSSLALYHGSPGVDALFIEVCDNQIQVRSINEQDSPDCYIVGSPIEISRALSGRANEASITGPLAPWQNLVYKLGLDWKQFLQPLLGDEFASMLGSGLNHSMQVRQNAITELARLASNFRQHEQGLYMPFPTLSAAHAMVKDAIKGLNRS